MKKILQAQLFIIILFCIFAFSACGAVDFKINFIVDGEIYATVSTNGGETVKMPDNPVKDDYTFDGWFWDKDTWAKPFTANSLLDAPLSSDMSVYAKWKEDEKPNKNALLISANGFTLDGNNGKISVSNDTETYSFINQIQVSAGASWVISTDIYGMQTIVTKTIPLNIGDNTVYLLVTSGDGNNINLYTMTIRRRPIYTVSFNTDGGTVVASQQIEEGSFAIEPTTTKVGYTFTGWNYDFNEQITDNTVITAQWVYYTLTAGVNNNKAGTITRFSDTKITVDDSVTVTATTNAGYTFDGWYNGDCLLTSELNYTFNMPRENLIYTAKWTANTDTPYKIEYYLENLDDDNYTLQENDTENLTGITGATITATKTFEHFTVVYGTDTGNINGNGNTVLKVYYRRDKYTVQILSSNDGVTLSQTFNGQYKYGYIIPEITATVNLGYDWQGWYSDSEFMTNDTVIPSFPVDKNINYVAHCSLKAEMANFKFTSTATVCTITGIKDKTVTEIIVPDYVTAINQGSFRSCSSLESITIPFVGGSKKTASETYQYPFGYIFGTSSYTGGTATEQYYYGSGTSSTTNTTYYIPSSLKTVTVTGGNILYSAFRNCSKLTSVIIGNSVTSIGENAFRHCSSLTSVTILDSVTSIGENAFCNCSGLTSVTIGNGVKSIGNYAFSYCSSLTSITIGNSVTSIGAYAFFYCSSLTRITFKGTKSQWQVINKDYEWKDSVPASCVVHCTDGDLNI